MNVRKAQRLRDMLLLIGFFMMLGSYIYEPLFVPGMAVALSCLVPHFLWNKCPHCGRQLGRNEAEFCQFCGEKID
jgi:hypothetical protein